MYCEHCGEPTIESAHEPSRAVLEAHEPCRLALEMEPPRYCAECRRRMVVQVTPAGWTARCVEHGVLASV